MVGCKSLNVNFLLDVRAGRRTARRKRKWLIVREIWPTTKMRIIARKGMAVSKRTEGDGIVDKTRLRREN